MRRTPSSLLLALFLACAGCDCGQSGSPTDPFADGGPVAPNGVPKQIAAGGHHSCAIMADDTVRCWGAGNASQLGQGHSGDSLTAIAVPGLTGVAQIALGYEFSCARTSAGGASCWGANPGGALGNGGTNIEVSPTPVSLPSIVRLGDFTMGHWSSCAIHGGNALSCWGDASRGQLGEGTVDTNDHASPLAVSLTNVERLALGYFHVCASHGGGNVSCWGSNGWGETGNGMFSSTPEPTPQTVTGVTTAIQLAAGQQWSCALLADHTLRCWGDNRNGQLGDDSTSFRPSATPVPNFDHVVQVAAGRKHACAVKDDGSLYCWGRNDEGQLGDRTHTERHVPTLVPGLAGVRQVALGDVHTCALLDSGAVRCFGSNSDGQLGDGTNADRSAPSYVLWE